MRVRVRAATVAWVVALLAARARAQTYPTPTNGDFGDNGPFAVSVNTFTNPIYQTSSGGDTLVVSVYHPSGPINPSLPTIFFAHGYTTPIGDAANYIAIAVLLAFGLYTLIGSEEREQRAIARLADARGTGALLLGLSISLDELAIGFTLGLLRLPAALAIALIALQAVILTQLGLRLGNRLSERLREAATRHAGRPEIDPEVVTSRFEEAMRSLVEAPR